MYKENGYPPFAIENNKQHMLITKEFSIVVIVVVVTGEVLR
jgi:hypothetical protein